MDGYVHFYKSFHKDIACSLAIFHDLILNSVDQCMQSMELIGRDIYMGIIHIIKR